MTRWEFDQLAYISSNLRAAVDAIDAVLIEAKRRFEREDAHQSALEQSTQERPCKTPSNGTA
jgi:hypothetical protein